MYRSTATRQRSRTCNRWAAALSTLSALLFAFPAFTSPQVTLHPGGTIEASRVTPGGSLAWSWAARTLDGWVSEVSLAASETFDDDRDGTLHFEAPRTGWPVMLLVGVDTATGAVAIASPAEDDDSGASKSAMGSDRPATWHATLEHLDTVTVRRNTETGAFSRIAFPGHRARVLLVRPGTGAWHLALSDGSGLDRGDDGDGLIELALGDMGILTPGSAPAPSALALDDVVVVVDPQHMTGRFVSLSDPSVHWDTIPRNSEATKPEEVAR